VHPRDGGGVKRTAAAGCDKCDRSGPGGAGFVWQPLKKSVKRYGKRWRETPEATHPLRQGVGRPRVDGRERQYYTVKE
jgi:hypothetical protein